MRNRVGLVRIGKRVTLTVMRGETLLTIEADLMAPLPDDAATPAAPRAHDRIDT